MFIKNTINKSIPELIEKIGYVFNPLLLTFKDEKNKLLIFYFHGLYESSVQKELQHVDPQNNLTVSQFVKFIEYFLLHKYHFIKPEDLVKPLPEGRRYAMITFDDGYFNNILAIEVLKKYRIPAAFFITTNYIRERKSYWWDIIYKYRVKQGISVKNIRNEQQLLKQRKWFEIDAYIEKEFGKKCHKPWSDIDRPFTESEIRSLADNPLVSIGNHTHHHAILTNYDENEIKRELSDCNEIITELTGKKPVSVAFPNGNYNNKIVGLAEKCGFQFAFTTDEKINFLKFESGKMFSLDRFMARTSDIKRYGTFIRLNYDPYDLFTRLKKTIRF